MTEQLGEIEREFERIQGEAQQLAASLTDAQFRWRPGGDRWSIAECLEHLNLAGSAYLPVLDEAIGRARARGWTRRKSFRPGLWGRWLIRSQEPPAKTRFKAPSPWRPSGPRPRDEVLPDFLELQDELLRRVRLAEGLDLARVKLTSPASRLLRRSLGTRFPFLAAHERRHLWQAGQVRSSPRFPQA